MLTYMYARRLISKYEQPKLLILQSGFEVRTRAAKVTKVD